MPLLICNSAAFCGKCDYTRVQGLLGGRRDTDFCRGGKRGHFIPKSGAFASDFVIKYAAA